MVLGASSAPIWVADTPKRLRECQLKRSNYSATILATKNLGMSLKTQKKAHTLRYTPVNSVNRYLFAGAGFEPATFRL